jgi:tape measure domain-containing protein
MANERIQIEINATDNASGVLARVQGNLKGFHSNIMEAASASRTFALGLGVVGGAVAGFGAMAIKAAADAEQTKISFTTMLGSAENAGKFIKDLTDFAKRTPFELKGLEESSKRLLAYGRTQEQVLPDLKILGDIAAGVGTEKLPQLILAFGQVNAATKLTGMELRQFTEAGVPLIEALAKTLGVTNAEIKDMVSEGEIGFEEVRAALAGMTTEGGKFNNLMDAQSKSLNGMISNMKDAWDIFLRGEGQALLEWAKQFTQLVIYIIQNVLPKLIGMIKEVTSFFQEHTTALYIVVGAIIGALIPTIYAAIAAFVALGIALLPYMVAGAIIGGLIAGIVALVKHWDDIKAKTKEIWEGILAVIKQVWDGIKQTIKDAVDAVLGYLQPFFAAVDKVKNAAGQAVSSAKSFGSNVIGGAKGLVGFQSGGIVGGALGAAQLAIVHGGERVIPNMSTFPSGGGFGGSITVNISGNNISSDMDLRDITTKVSEEIMRTLRMTMNI